MLVRNRASLGIENQRTKRVKTFRSNCIDFCPTTTMYYAYSTIKAPDKGEVGGSSPPRPTIQIISKYGPILTFPLFGDLPQKTVLSTVCQLYDWPEGSTLRGVKTLRVKAEQLASIWLCRVRPTDSAGLGRGGGQSNPLGGSLDYFREESVDFCLPPEIPGHHQITSSPLYLRNSLSQVITGTSSASACAISMRSNGSRWYTGSVISPNTCASAYGSMLTCRRLSASIASSRLRFNFPAAFFMAISASEMTLSSRWLAGSPITVRAFRDNLSGSSMAKRKATVSSRTRISSGPPGRRPLPRPSSVSTSPGRARSSCLSGNPTRASSQSAWSCAPGPQRACRDDRL